ncbi:hypothetical protein KSS87_016699, partial [Heliosperma pusillum]
IVILVVDFVDVLIIIVVDVAAINFFGMMEANEQAKGEDGRRSNK